MTFDYNTTRSKLLLSEYGRNVQNMVKYICELPTKDERNKYAQVVIDLMGFLNPHLRDVADFKHKLWDHLHIISNFKIDVDSPYPIPQMDAIHFKPEPLAYPQQRIKYKHYGKTVELMIAKARDVEDPQHRQYMAQSIANFMKMAYATWNKDSVTDDTIFNDLNILSEGQLQVEENINLQKVEVRPPQQNQNTNRPRNQNNKNRQNNNRNSQGGTNNSRQRNNNNNGKRF